MFKQAKSLQTVRATLLVLAACLLVSCGNESGSNDARNLVVTSVTVEHQGQPLGIDTASPRISWIVTADYNGAVQSAFELRVSTDESNSGDVWNTGRIDSADSFDVVYGGAPLSSNTRYYLSVKTWDGELESAWSEPAWFETAFLDVADFKGDWIGRVAERQPQETPEVLLRKEFELGNKSVDSARLYISGLGYYKAYINGQRVGDHELDPAFTPFDQRVLYVTHDVTSLLQAGENALGVSLGRGYYADFGNIDTQFAPWLSEPKLKLQLDVRYADGSVQTLVSDTSWAAADGPTLTNNVKNGESYDARREQPGWTETGFDAGDWQAAVLASAPPGTLAAQHIEPVRVTGELPEPVVTRVSDTVSVYDFRTTRAGWARVALTGPEGAAVTIRYGEKLTGEGLVNSGNDGPFGGTPVQSYNYVLRGDPAGEVYTPSYSYNGYRFVQIEAPVDVQVTSVVGQVLHNDVAVTGTFESSNELLNRYHDAMVRSLLSNMHHIPTDTPMYEKRGWAADALLMVDSALMNLASENFWEKWMRDHRYNQAADGGIAVIVPHQNPGSTEGDPFTGMTGDPIWSSSYVLVNYALYRHRGDLRTLQENYDGMQRWMSKWMGMLEETGYVFDGRTWGDHEPAYGSGMSNDLVGTAYVYRSARALADIAEALGNDADKLTYLAFADKVRDAVNAQFYDPQSGHYDFPYEAQSFGPPPGMAAAAPGGGGAPGGNGPAAGNGPPGGNGPPAANAAPGGDGAPGGNEVPEAFRRMMRLSPEEVDAKQFQTDNVLPLALGLVPEGGRTTLCEQLQQDVRVTNESHITTGATVLKDVMPVLTECGDAELAFEAATNPTFPGWGFWFEGLNGTKGRGGETIIVDTFWEAWGEGARSHNHAFRGTIDDWLYQYLAGIKAGEPGYRRIRIKPYPVGDVTFARASILTPLGEAVSSWRKDDDSFQLEVSIPVGSTAEIQVPLVRAGSTQINGDVPQVGTRDGYAVYEVGSGTYRFVAR